MKSKLSLIGAVLIALGLGYAVRPRDTPVAPRPVAKAAVTILQPAGPEELKMARLYSRHYAYMGKDHPDEVIEAGRWTRYYARRAGVEKYMSTLLCMWHIESHYLDLAGADGKSFGRTQTCYGYPPQLRQWWAKRGEPLGTDKEIRTQMAYGVAEFVMKHQAAHGDLWDTVRRYNGCGPDSIYYARKVFRARDAIYGLGSPKEKPAPCPPRKHRKKSAKNSTRKQKHKPTRR